MELNFLILYPDLMNLNGDIGNINILKYRSEQRNIKINIDEYRKFDSNLNLEKYDLIFLGSGSELNQKVVMSELKKIKDKLIKSINKGTFYLLIGSGCHIFGKYYYDSNKEKTKGLGIFDYYTEFKDELYGDIVLHVSIDGKDMQVIGFENSHNNIVNSSNSFGIISKCRNKKNKGKEEGILFTNMIGTNLYGPLLSKNPSLADFIIKKMVDRKYNTSIVLKNINDNFESKARMNMLARLK